MSKNKLVNCETCQKEIALSSEECIHCGAKNEYVHPKIKAVLEKIHGLPLGGKYAYHCDRNVLRISMDRGKELEKGSAVLDFIKAVCCLVLLVIANGLDLYTRWAAVFQIIFTLSIVYYGGKIAFKVGKILLLGESERFLDCTVTINSNDVPVFRSNDRDRFAPVYRLFNENEEKKSA